MLGGRYERISFVVHEGLVTEALDLVARLEASVEIVAAALLRSLGPPLATVLELSRRHP